MAEVIRELGLRPGSYDLMWGHVRRTGVDASHIMVNAPARRGPRPGGSGGRRRWTDEQLTSAVVEASTYAEVLRALGYEPSGGIHSYIKAHIAWLGLDTSHFVGQAWNKGRTFPFRPSRPLSEVLVENSTATSTSVRRRLIKAGLREPLCAWCGLDEWRGQRLPLALDHINGVHSDNRLENLRILCPNCHSQTPTWCARNRGQGIVVGQEPA